MSTPQSRAIDLTLLNLTNIFGQKDKTTRMQAIADLWAPSSDVLFVDTLGVFKSHEAISEMVEKIQGMSGEGDEFVALGNVACLKHDDREDIWVTKVKWGIETASSGEMGLTGEDVLTIVGGKIKACYTFLDSK
ncbi:hypothetical protein J4E90_006519 [Alternaria incomplexa]|uniref:uncharacterized protein n=1 Tax=Alternaria incomplexa TaxID=1187928 RepID=UPI00221E9E04|nr:uncharacterized protein J4E90_006519 [Alternaria incomplexa]KAI4911702.1 hypothetical protein J4E90_006519 [Alternaria incomplexa]